MSKVRMLVEHLRLTPPEKAETYQQTAVIPLPAYYRLCGVSEYLQISRTRLSGMLLAAAIDDAIASLGTADPLNIEGQDFASPADYVLYRAMVEEEDQKRVEKYTSEESPKRDCKTTV